MKKLASLILALAMCLALGVPAFATEEGQMETSIDPMLPTLDVKFPDGATIILNPYRMVYSATTTVTGIDKNDRFQVMNAVFSFESKTLSAVAVKATFTGEVAGEAEFSSTAIAPGDTNKKVNLTLTYDTAKSANAAIPAVKLDSNNKPTNQLVISDSEQTKEWTLPAAEKSNNSVTPQRIDMQFGGTCSDAPSESPWTADDTVACGIVFEVVPVTAYPMVTMTYQQASTSPDLTISTRPKLTDFKDTGTVTKLYVGDATAATLTEVTLSTGNATWDGETLTIVGSVIGTALGNGTDGKAKRVVAELSYAAKDGTTKTYGYEAKVTVKPIPS